MDEHLNSHCQSILAEVEIDAGDLAVLKGFWHSLGGSGGLDGVTINENRVLGGHTVGLEDVNGLNWVFCLASMVDGLDVLHGCDDHFGEKVTLGIKKLGGHGGFGGIDQGISSKSINLHTEVFLDVLYGLFERKSETRHNGGGMNTVLDEFISSLEKLGSEDNN